MIFRLNFAIKIRVTKNMLENRNAFKINKHFEFITLLPVFHAILFLIGDGFRQRSPVAFVPAAAVPLPVRNLHEGENRSTLQHHDRVPRLPAGSRRPQGVSVKDGSQV